MVVEVTVVVGGEAADGMAIAAARLHRLCTVEG